MDRKRRRTAQELVLAARQEVVENSQKIAKPQREQRQKQDSLSFKELN